MKSFVRFSSAALVLLLSIAPRARTQSQTAASIVGTVTDPRGAGIGNAQVSVESIGASGGPRSAAKIATVITPYDGRFTFSLEPGRYRVTCVVDSFSPFHQDVTVAAGEFREMPIRLTLEPLSEKVVVTAESIPVDAESAAIPVTILTHTDIEQRVATSLPDLLATLPGFSLGRTGAEGGQTSLFLDGGNSNYTKVLVDGAPVNQPGGLMDFSNFTLDDVEKIEVVQGSESALYGSDAMTGVIQVFTHHGTTRIPELKLFAEGGNFATGRGGAQISGLLDHFDYAAAASDFETTGQSLNDAFRNRTLSGNFGWRFTNTARVSLSLRDDVSAAGTPGPTLIAPTNLTDSIGFHNFSGSLHGEFTTGSRWHHQFSASDAYTRELNFDPLFQTFYQFNRSNFAGQSTYLINGVTATAGYEYEVENGFISFIGTHARRNNQAGFVDVRWQPRARLSLNAGARAEDNANFGTRVMPRAGISYALRSAQGAFGDTRLRASYGQGIVEPRFDQTFGTDPCFPGNPHLLPEESRTVHAGVEQKLASDRVRLTVDYFDSRFRNIISFQSDPVTFCGTFFNTNLARARGTNLDGEARIARWLTAAANYTYDSTRVLAVPDASDPNYFLGSRLLRRPVNSGNAMLNASYRRMNWNFSGYFTGRRLDYNYPGQIVNPGYARFDFAGSYNLPHGFSFYGRIANMANKKYQDAFGYPALGREFRIGMTYTTHRE
jgi:vitamin B12 transporter